MIVHALDQQIPFTTKDGSVIRSILDSSNAPVRHQSLAEASLPPWTATQRHFHRLTEEFYFITEGTATMEMDGQTQDVKPGDAILIPPGAWHQITAGASTVRLLCCCAPPYSHDDTFFE